MWCEHDVARDASLRQNIASIFSIRCGADSGGRGECADASCFLDPFRCVSAAGIQLVFRNFFCLFFMFRLLQRRDANSRPRQAFSLLQGLALRQFLVVALARYFDQLSPIDCAERLIGERCIVPA